MSRKIRQIVLMLLVAMLFTLFSGCAGKHELPEKSGKLPTERLSNDTESLKTDTDKLQPPKEKTDINIAALKGPTSLGMLKMMEDAKAGKTANNYHFTVAGAADEITAGILKGDYPLAAIPCNLASVLYNKSDGGITMLGINTLGVLYIVETGDTIKSVTDLKGRRIYSTGKGMTPEYTLNQLLMAAGLDPERDVTVTFCAEATEVASILSETENAVAMLPQPFVTTVLMNNERARIALDVTEEWERLSPGTTIVTGVVVANTKFLNGNRGAVLEFLSEYADSAEFAVNEPEKAAALSEKFGIFKEAVAKRAMPYCNIVFLEGAEMKEKAGAYLQVLFEQNPAAVGGKLPEDNFFFER